MQWYDVNDQLPPDGEDVLVSDGSEISIATYYTDHRRPEWSGWHAPSTIDIGPEGEGLDMNVTYWMPLGPLLWMLGVRRSDEGQS